MKARDRIRHSIYRSHRANTQMDLLNSRRLKASQLAWAGYAADSLIAEGYRKPDILGYVVLSRDGPQREVGLRGEDQHEQRGLK